MLPQSRQVLQPTSIQRVRTVSDFVRQALQRSVAFRARMYCRCHPTCGTDLELQQAKIVASCNVHRLDPWANPRDVLERLPTQPARRTAPAIGGPPSRPGDMPRHPRRLLVRRPFVHLTLTVEQVFQMICQPGRSESTLHSAPDVVSPSASAVPRFELGRKAPKQLTLLL